jgi:dihydrofolate reductase/thymidylate synthase
VLKINPDKTDIDSFCFDDFELEGYDPCKKIAMKMAV